MGQNKDLRGKRLWQNQNIQGQEKKEYANIKSEFEEDRFFRAEAIRLQLSQIEQGKWILLLTIIAIGIGIVSYLGGD